MTDDEAVLLIVQVGFDLGNNIVAVHWILERCKKAESRDRKIEIYNSNKEALLITVKDVLLALSDKIEIIKQFQFEHGDIFDPDLEDLLEGEEQIKNRIEALESVLMAEGDPIINIETVDNQYAGIMSISESLQLFKRVKEIKSERAVGEGVDPIEDDSRRTENDGYYSGQKK